MNEENIEKDLDNDSIEESPEKTIDESSEENETPSPDEKSEDETNTEKEESENEPEPPTEEKEEEKPDIPYGETAKEWALRKEVEKLRSRLKKERSEDLFIKNEDNESDKHSPKNELLEKYDQEQLNELGEIIKAKAEEMGFVKKEELRAETYKETADSILNSFLEEHKEYLPENDKDNILWNRFREEFQMYKQPQNPKDFKKIYNRIHNSIFNINSGNLNKINAQQEKIRVASHTGKTGNANLPKNTKTDIDLSGLKGFTKEELNDLIS